MIADYKNPFTTTGSINSWTYLANVKNISNMYPYGKSYGTDATYDRTDDYRYGFNGMEKEKNIGQGFSDFGARVYDANFPMFLSRDKFESQFPFYSPYNHAVGNPVVVKDNDGNIWALYSKNDLESEVEYAKSTIKMLFDNKIQVDITNDIVTLTFVNSGRESLDLNQQLLYDELMKVITADETVYQEILVDDMAVNIGSYSMDDRDPSRPGGIDFGDISKFGLNPETKFYAISALAHEGNEQLKRITGIVTFDEYGNPNGISRDYKLAHSLASAVEEKVGNYKKVRWGLDGPDKSWGKGSTVSIESGVYKMVINVGGYDGFGSEVFSFIGLTDKAAYKTIEATYKNGVIVDTDIKDGDTLEGDSFEP